MLDRIAGGSIGLFDNTKQEVLWLTGVALLLAFFISIEYEWIIRPYAILRDDAALHVSGREPRRGARAPEWEPRGIRLDYQSMASKTFFWRAFGAWLPVLRVPVNLGSDVLEYRYVIEGMLAGLKHAFHRAFLHWSSPLVAFRRGLAILGITVLALFAGEHWFGPVACCPSPGNLGGLICGTGGDRLLKALRWAPLRREAAEQSPETGATQSGSSNGPRDPKLLVDRVVLVRDAGVPSLHGLRVYHLLVLLLFAVAYHRVRQAVAISPYLGTHERISRLLDSLSSRLREESRPDRSKLTEWMLAIIGREKVEQKEFAPFDPRTVELAFLQILADTQNPAVLLPFTRRGRVSPPIPEIVFVFDELDKIGDLPPTPVAQTGDGAKTSGAEREPHDIERERARALHRLFADLKNILSSGRARFIFLGGRNLHDEWLADQSSRRSLLTNTFDAEIYLPSLLIEDIDGRPAGTKLEGIARYVNAHRERAIELHRKSRINTFAPWLKLGSEDRKLASFIQGPLTEDPYSGGGMASASKMLVLTRDGEAKPWADELVAAFIQFLGYRSRGNVKRLKDLLEGFIQPADREIDPADRATFNCEHVLIFHDRDRFRIQLIADIYRQVEPILWARLAYRDDKLSYNVLYLADYLLKFHRRAFTWSNLGRVDELVHIHRAPDLRSVLEEMVLNWSEHYLHLINNGMYDYRFESQFARELEYLSRQSEQELAILNFTLDESQQLRSTYAARLSTLKEATAVDFIIGLGELHEFDEEFELARYYYAWAVRTLDEAFNLQTGVEKTAPISYSVLTEVQSGYEAARRIVSWGIGRVRLMLQIAMTYERERDLEHAQAEYRDARTLAWAIIRGLLASPEALRLLTSRPWYEDLATRQPTHGYLWTLKHLNILFQPVFAEAWLAEKSVGGVDTGPSLLERELWELRDIFPFEGSDEFSAVPELPRNPVDVQHSNFSLIFAELHQKAGTLYFFKGRQLVPSRPPRRGDLKGTEGYLLRAQSHYAASLHEIRRFNDYRRRSSAIKFNDTAEVTWETIRKGGWPEYVYRIGAGALCNLGEAMLARVSLQRLIKEADSAPRVRGGDEDALSRAYRQIGAWLDRTEQQGAWSEAVCAVFPSCDITTHRELSAWFGEPAPRPMKKGQLLLFKGLDSDVERLVASLLFSLTGAHLLEEAGYFPGAADEYLRVVRTVIHYVWWIRMVQVLGECDAGRSEEARRWKAAFVATAGRPLLPGIARDLIWLGVTRLEHVKDLHLRTGEARIPMSRNPKRWVQPQLSTYACSLALGVLQLAPDFAEPVARLCRVLDLRPRTATRVCFRSRLMDVLDERSFPMFNRLEGLKALIDDAVLGEQSPSSAEQKQTADHISESIELEGLYKSPLHFVPLYSGLTLALACLKGRTVASSREIARQKLAASQQMVTLKRSYYEAISGLYYLYDDFNDRTIHFNHAVQMSGLELASCLLACLDGGGVAVTPRQPMRGKGMERLDREDRRLFERYRLEWNEMASVDPYHAIDNRRSKAEKESILGTGEPWLSGCLAKLQDLGWHPPDHGRALDFGCGVGRLARPLARRFERVVGVDFAEAMLAEALTVHWDTEQVEFRLQAELKPLVFADSSFNLVVCLLVLQHQPHERHVRWWLSELLRVLEPAGRLVFQLPYATAWRQRFQPRRRSYTWLRRLGLPSRVLMARTVEPISMLSVPEARVKQIVDEAGGTILHIHRDDKCAGPDHPSSTYYVGRKVACMKPSAS